MTSSASDSRAGCDGQPPRRESSGSRPSLSHKEIGGNEIRDRKIRGKKIKGREIGGKNIQGREIEDRKIEDRKIEDKKTGDEDPPMGEVGPRIDETHGSDGDVVQGIPRMCFCSFVVALSVHGPRSVRAAHPTSGSPRIADGPRWPCRV